MHYAVAVVAIVGADNIVGVAADNVATTVYIYLKVLVYGGHFALQRLRFECDLSFLQLSVGVSEAL